MNRLFDKLADFIVDRRGLVLLFLGLITVVASIGHYNPRLVLNLFEPTQVEETSDTRNDFGEPPPNVDPISLSAADVVIVCQSETFFTPEGATAMRDVVDELEALDQVKRVLWMDRVPILNIFGLPEPLFPRSKASQQRFDAAKEKALAHPLVKGQLLSEDTKTMLMMVSLDRNHVLSDYEATGLLKETANAAKGDFDVSFQITGMIPTAIAAISQHEANQLKYQVIGYGMILLMSVLLFRGLRAVMIVALAPGLGVFWTIGMIRYFEYTRNPLIDVILPILVSLVGLTDGVHLMVQIRKLRAEGLGERPAARKGLRLVGLACFLTSLTTAIGFASLTLAKSTWVQQFGECCVVGVLLCFISVITVIPLASSTWLGRNLHQGQKNSLIDRNLGRISVLIDAVLKRPSLMSIVAIITTVVLIGTSLTLQPDHRRSNDFPPDAEATIALKHMDGAFGGLEFAQVDVSWTNDVPSDSPEILEVLIEVDDFLKTEDLIGHPLSIRNLVDAQPGSGPPAERMSMIELLPPPLKRAFYTPEYRSATISFRARDIGIAAYDPVFKRVEAKLAEIIKDHPNFRLELSGDAVARWRELYQIVVDLALSLGTASVIIFFVLALVYRSIRLALISIIPNMFPLAVTGTYLSLAGFNLEIVMVCNFTVCLGVAVDDTIHFLTRYNEEREVTPDKNTAIRNAFTGVGTALIMTTTVLVAGFSTVIMSESRDHRIFATMGAITIASALFGDLVFLPALLSRFIKQDDPNSTETESHVTEVSAQD